MQEQRIDDEIEQVKALAARRLEELCQPQASASVCAAARHARRFPSQAARLSAASSA